MVKYKDREAKARIHGIQAQMRTFDDFFELRLDILFLRYSDNLSTSLQAENLCAAEAQKIEFITGRLHLVRDIAAQKEFDIAI